MPPHTINASPLRYPGGKTRACKIIDEILQEYYEPTQFDTLVSPFFGGGSFEFYVQHKYGYKLEVNDKFQPLYHFWQQAKTNNTALCAALRQIPTVTKEQFTTYRQEIMQQTDPLQQAVAYFIINRCSFSGATLSGGFSAEASAKRYTKSSVDRVAALNLSGVEFTNIDFAPVIQAAPASALLFLDPPYYLNKKSKLYGNNGDMHENFDHQKLYDVLKTKKNWLLTYNNCDYIKTLYKDYTILEVDWTYGMNKTKASSEVIILPN